jgi:hypothetical protein
MMVVTDRRQLYYGADSKLMVDAVIYDKGLVVIWRNLR